VSVVGRVRLWGCVSRVTQQPGRDVGWPTDTGWPCFVLLQAGSALSCLVAVCYAQLACLPELCLTVTPHTQGPCLVHWGQVAQGLSCAVRACSLLPLQHCWSGPPPTAGCGLVGGWLARMHCGCHVSGPTQRIAAGWRCGGCNALQPFAAHRTWGLGVSGCVWCVDSGPCCGAVGWDACWHLGLVGLGSGWGSPPLCVVGWRCHRPAVLGVSWRVLARASSLLLRLVLGRRGE
jgi:hypothetical protein